MLFPRVFPVYSSNNKGPKFPLYCKYQLLKYKPWQTTQENAWDNQPATNEIYITKWKEFLQTPYAKQHVPDWHDKLDTVQNYDENDSNTDHITPELPQREEWMLLADLMPGSFVTNEEPQQIVNSDYNWQNDRLKYQKNQIREMSSWIRTNKEALRERTIPEQNCNITTFSYMQNCAYDRIKGNLVQRIHYCL